FARAPMPVAKLATLLGALRGLRLPGAALSKHRYPSAGDLYPVQVYALVAPGRVDGLAGGAWYYRPDQHRLVRLGDAGLDARHHAVGNRALVAGAAFALVLAARPEAIAPLYGPMARDFCLLEAGHMGQLLMDAAPAEAIGLCPVGGVDYAALRETLRLTPEDWPLYTLVGGSIDGVVAEAAAPTFDVDALRDALAAELPAYLVPARIIALDALPLTANGKVDRRALPDPVAVAPTEAPVAPRTEIEARVARIIAALVGVEAVDVRRNFYDLGATWLQLVELHHRLHDELAVDVSVTELFHHATVAALAAHLGDVAPVDAAPAPAVVAPVSAPQPATTDDGIAIVGLAGRFPGAFDVAELLENLRAGRVGIRPLTADALAQVDPARREAPSFIAVGASIEAPFAFDAEFFGYPPREAEGVDPQIRLFLEHCHLALEDAGCPPERVARRVGVFGGSSFNTYLSDRAPDVLSGISAVHFQRFVGNDKDYVATQVAYRLDLVGPAIGVQTACSTSLVAVHLACQSLRAGECDVALAGGVTVKMPRANGHTSEVAGV
ncbi:MAG: nitroreductase family protein, partial [Myxococcales bacterium]|nr:nitroreductase family protein [Myxococcales bacterium]